MKEHKPVAVLKLGKRIAGVILALRLIITRMTGNPAFPTPPVTMAEFGTLVDALSTAHVTVATRVSGAATERSARLRPVKLAAEQLRSYVQSVAEPHSVADAQALIESAGMKVKQVHNAIKPDFAVRAGATPGTAVLIARSPGKPAVFEWQYSTDQKTWVNVQSTPIATATAVGLAPLTTYYFRYRTIQRSGEQPWSQIVSLALL